MTDTAHTVSSQGTEQEEANKQVSIAFYEAALNEHDFEKAKQFMGATYTQHNPNASDDVAGFAGFLAFLREHHPLSRGIIKRVWADGDYVILHVLERRHPDDRGDAVVDIFRLEAGKIVEHWDVTQPIPEKLAHANGMI